MANKKTKETKTDNKASKVKKATPKAKTTRKPKAKEEPVVENAEVKVEEPVVVEEGGSKEFPNRTEKINVSVIDVKDVKEALENGSEMIPVKTEEVVVSVIDVNKIKKAMEEGRIPDNRTTSEPEGVITHGESLVHPETPENNDRYEVTYDVAVDENNSVSVSGGEKETNTLSVTQQEEPEENKTYEIVDEQVNEVLDEHERVKQMEEEAKEYNIPVDENGGNTVSTYENASSITCIEEKQVQELAEETKQEEKPKKKRRFGFMYRWFGAQIDL